MKEKRRKGWSIIGAVAFAIMACLTAQGCATKPNCPAQDVYYMIMTPLGPLVGKMPKGFLDNPGNYRTEEQIKELMKQQRTPSPDPSHEGSGGTGKEKGCGI